MKKSELKAKIREEIITQLSEGNNEINESPMSKAIEDLAKKLGVPVKDLKDKIDSIKKMEDDKAGREAKKAVAEEEKVDVDVDVEEKGEEVDVDVEDEVVGDEPQKAELVRGEEPGLSQEEEDIQNALKIAYDQAKSIGDEKLADQIGNSITFFTRSHVVTGR